MRRLNEKRMARLMAMHFVVILLLALCGVIGTTVYAGVANQETHILSFDWMIDNPAAEEIYAVATPGSYWITDMDYGNQYDFTLVNRTKYQITDWSVSVTVPEGCVVDSSWNGEWTTDGTTLTFFPEGVNTTVLARNEVSFGLVMHSPKLCNMSQVTINFCKFKEPTRYGLFWTSILVAIIDIVFYTASILISFRVKRYSETHAAYKDLVRESLRTIANIIDTKDEYTKGHSLRVAIYSRMIAERMGYSEYDQERIYYIGLLHDIGKVGIPASILTKPGRLNDEEFEIIKRHPAMGSSIMKDFSSIPGVQFGIKYHHERYDGKGYNEGLKGDEIPIEGRIICVADSYDAMSSRRCYRNALSYDFILDELKRNSGLQFDPEILKHMINMVEEGYAPVSEAEMDDYEI